MANSQGRASSPGTSESLRQAIIMASAAIASGSGLPRRRAYAVTSPRCAKTVRMRASACTRSVNRPASGTARISLNRYSERPSRTTLLGRFAPGLPSLRRSPLKATDQRSHPHVAAYDRDSGFVDDG